MTFNDYLHDFCVTEACSKDDLFRRDGSPSSLGRKAFAEAIYAEVDMCEAIAYFLPTDTLCKTLDANITRLEKAIAEKEGTEPRSVEPVRLRKQNRKTHVWTGAEISDVRRRLENGWSYAQIARHLGVPVYVVSYADSCGMFA